MTVWPASRNARTALLPNLWRSRDAPTTATTRGIRHYRPPGPGPQVAYSTCRDHERAIRQWQRGAVMHDTAEPSLQWLAVRRPVLTLLLFSFLTFGIGLGRQAITEADEAYYA